MQVRFTVTYQVTIPNWPDVVNTAGRLSVDPRGALWAIERHCSDTGELILLKRYVDNGAAQYYWETDTREAYESGDDVIREWTWYMNYVAGDGIKMDVED